MERGDMTDRPGSALPDATRLAVERTRLAHERTMMAWVRTATSLISLGFTIYKFFQYLREEQATAAAAASPIGPRGFALIMITIGLTALCLATVEHQRGMQALRAEYGQVVPRSLATAIGGLVALLGTAGLLAVLFQQ
jgi:putative membrane protein